MHKHTQSDDIPGDTPFGPLVFRPWLPDAIRTLDDEELRVLLLALLQEWRARLQMRNA